MKSYPPRVTFAFCKTKIHQKCFDLGGSNESGDMGCHALKLIWKKTCGAVLRSVHTPDCFFVSVKTRAITPKQIDGAHGPKKSQLTCVNCGKDADVSDQRSTGCGTCGCDICPRPIQPKYEVSRYLRLRGMRPRGFSKNKENCG